MKFPVIPIFGALILTASLSAPLRGAAEPENVEISIQGGERQEGKAASDNLSIEIKNKDATGNPQEKDGNVRIEVGGVIKDQILKSLEGRQDMSGHSGLPDEDDEDGEGDETGADKNNAANIRIDAKVDDAGFFSAGTLAVLTGLAAVVGFFGVIALALYLSYRKARNHQNMIRDLVEKRGADMPLEILHEITPAQRDLRRGVILTGLGLGLSGFLMAEEGITSGEWGLGLLPLFLGLGYLTLWKLNRKDR